MRRKEGRQGHTMTQEQRDAKRAEWRAKRAEHVAKRQAKLHDALKLTPRRRSRPGPPTRRADQAGSAIRWRRGDRADWKAMPAPQRMEKRIEMAKQRIARMESHLAAHEDLLRDADA